MKVFVAHNKVSDGDLAGTIAGKLRVMGFDVFFDEDSLPPGQSFDSRIEDAVNASDIFVFLISNASLQAKYARTELAIAKRRFRNPNGRVLPVLVEKVETTSIDPYLRPIMFQEQEGDLATDVALRVKAMARLRRKRTLLLVGIAAVALAAAGIVGAAMMWPKAQSAGPTELRVTSVQRHHEGRPNEGDAFVVAVLARNGDASPVTFEQLIVESRRSDMSAVVSHEGDQQYWLAVDPSRTKSWSFFVTWKQGDVAMRGGDFHDSFEWRVCWTVAKRRDCSEWRAWEPGGAFAPSNVRVLDTKIASRAKILEAAASEGDAAAGFWIGLGEPNELARLTLDGTVADRVALPGEPVRMTFADGHLAFVATHKPDQIVTIDLDRHQVVNAFAIPSEAGRADVVFSMAWDGARLWIVFDDVNGRKDEQALRVLEHDALRKVRYDKEIGRFGVDVDEMRLYARGNVVLGRSSFTPRYVFRFSMEHVWQVSGHEVSFIGCLQSMTATPARWLAITCGFSLSELVEQTWPDGTAVPIEANKALDERVIQKGLSDNYDEYSWDASAIAASDQTAVVALIRRDRQTYQVLETAVVYRDAAAIWRELLRDDIDVVELAVSSGYALVFARDKGNTKLLLVHLK